VFLHFVDRVTSTTTGRFEGDGGIDSRRGRDRFTLTVKAPNGSVVAFVDSVLTSGNMLSLAR
jgi:hypothetical protein